MGAGHPPAELHQIPRFDEREHLTEAIEGMVTRHNLAGRVVARITDCEPSMRVGRIRQERKLSSHMGCCIHRVESTTGIIFDGLGIKQTITLAHALVRRYSKSIGFTSCTA